MEQVPSGEIRTVRSALRQQRRDFDGDRRIEAEAAIARHVLSLPGVRDAAPVGRLSASAYLSCDGEVSLSGVIEAIHESPGSLALPALIPADSETGEGRAGGAAWSMEFRRFDAGDDLSVGAFDIVEPATGSAVSPADIGVVLAALVAFDTTGARIGRGGGHYDRSFGPTRDLAVRPLLVGIGFEFQRVGSIETRGHDVDMDAIVTELGVRWMPAAGRILG